LEGRGQLQNPLSLAGAAAGLTTAAEWREVFSRYSHIVLIANSGLNDVTALRQEYPGNTLFVFFNKVYKTLSEAFEGNAMLVSRAQPQGANIVYRDEVREVLDFFGSSTFVGILNLKVSPSEKFNSSEDFKNAPTGHLDLCEFANSFYTGGKTPTSGFALALWLADMRISASIVLAGFSAKRSEKWKVVSAHDWTLEQTFLRLLARSGTIVIHGDRPRNAFDALSERFPEISKSDITLAAADVLSERLSNTDAEVDKLISLTSVIRKLDQRIRGLRPSWMRKKKRL
jgi:hypothetical protein